MHYSVQHQEQPKRWGPIGEEGTDLKTFIKFRPSEEYIDNLYNELTIYWEALLAELPVLHSEPTQMRIHSLEENNGKSNDETDHLLFWPIGQQMLAEISRVLLDKFLPDIENPTIDTARTALNELNRLEWRLHQVPWRYFLLIQNPQENWIMRSEQRMQAVRCGRIIQQWILGLEDFDEGEIINLKKDWAAFLTPAQSEETIDKMWQQIEEMKSSISG